MKNHHTLTICHAQQHQPWTVPYSPGVMEAQDISVPHILGSHCVLHATKSLGKIAAVYEALDHVQSGVFTGLSRNQLETLRAMSADLMTAALRFANLHGFDLAQALVERVQEKNGEGYPDWERK